MSVDKNITGIVNASIHKYDNGKMQLLEDAIAVETPLLIKIKAPGKDVEDLVITMHTPVHTKDLVVGFLYSEGIIDLHDHIQDISIQENEALVKLTIDPIKKAERNTVATAACGMCGKTSLDAIDLVREFDLQKNKGKINAEQLLGMDAQLSVKQKLFEKTGGIHAAALFDFDGQLITVREDIGRHNAVDKVIGFMLGEKLDPSKVILYVSGRAGFELVQKALVSGISMMVAVGAPSSLAVEYAQNYGLTLIGFMQKSRFNLYSHPERLAAPLIKSLP